MKKMFVLILALLLLCACGVQEEEIHEEVLLPEINEPGSNGPSELVISEPENELGEGSRILENCIFKTADEKYGIQKDGKIVFEPVYDVFKTAGKIGERTIYALGKTEGTMPAIAYDDDARVRGIGERERVLYEFFFEDGSLILSIPADSFHFERNIGINPGTKAWLYLSLEGSQYVYEFNIDGEILSEKVTPKGKTGEAVNDYVLGYEKVCYYYGPTDMEIGLGLIDSEENEIVPPIYTYIYSPFEGRIVAGRSEGGLSGGTARILDSEGNIICDKYHAINFDELPDGRFIGVAYCAGEMSQLATVCRDENGEVMKGGYRFIDKDGNELSEVFASEKHEFIIRKGGITSEEKTIIAVYEDGTEKEINIYDYAFEP